MAEKQVAQTSNFNICVNDVPPLSGQPLLDLAEAIRITCEHDFQQLAQLFGTGDQFGPAGNRINVVIDPTLAAFGSGSIGQNAGFVGGGGTKIELAASAPPFKDRSRDQVEEAVRAAFVAELLEVFLSLRSASKPTLNPGKSDGEALSRIFAAMYHPIGYNDVIGRSMQASGGQLKFSASHWLSQVPRSDYVTNPYSNDGYLPSIGCGVLFLHYLHTQLRHSWPDIVHALAATLAETSVSLGEPGDSFSEFANILGSVFPTGSDYDLPVENVFPLLDVSRRGVDFYGSSRGDICSEGSPFQDSLISEGWVNVRPFPLCPVGLYHYQLQLDLGAESELTATSSGFGQPQFSWQIDDQDLQSGPVKFDAACWDDTDFMNPGVSKHLTAQVTVIGMVTTYHYKSTIELKMVSDMRSAPANVVVPLSVRVVEKTVSDPPLTVTAWSPIRLKQLCWDQKFKDDAERCQHHLRDVAVRHELWRRIVLLRTLPDPIPPWVGHGLEIAARIREELEILASYEPDLAHELSLRLGLSKSQR